MFPSECNSYNYTCVINTYYVLSISLLRILLGYLVHHGYTATAVQFAKNTGLELGETMESIKNRQSELLQE